MTTREVNGVMREIFWEPHPGAQSDFLQLESFEALYGGEAGPGKSWCILVGALRFLGDPHFTGIIFRRTMPELKKYMIERSYEFVRAAYPKSDYNKSDNVWTVPGGGRLIFSHLEHEEDKRAHQSAEYQYVGFDELTQFTLSQYLFLRARLRSVHGIPLMLRGATNPGGPGHDWVFDRFGPWLDPKSPVKARSGQPLWRRDVQDGEPQIKSAPFPKSRSIVFQRGRRSDNPSLDSDYEDVLMGLDPVTRAQWMDGDWLVRPAAGLYYRREWVVGLQGEKYLDEAPNDVRWVRHRDRAATEPSKENKNPDWTRGVKMGMTRSGLFIVGDVASIRTGPYGVKKFISDTAELDGRGCEIGIEQDPASAGKSEAEDYLRMLNKYNVHAWPVSKHKLVRFKPFSAATGGGTAGAGHVRMLRGPWNDAYHLELENFPDAEEAWKDDQVDATSGAYNTLTGPEVGEADNWARMGRKMQAARTARISAAKAVPVKAKPAVESAAVKVGTAKLGWLPK